MHQLSGLDTAFLSMETATTRGHVSSLIIYDRPDRADFNPYQAYRHQILTRLDKALPLVRRLVEVPLGLDNPYWIEDPNFDIDNHVRHLAVPPPGGQRELEELVAQEVAIPLDRSRPLWQVSVIEGLPDDSFAVLTKIHHAAVDGAVGAQMTIMLLNTDPNHDPFAETVVEVKGEPEPTGLELLARTGVNYLGRPRKIAQLQVRMLRDAASKNSLAAPVLTAAADAIRRGIPGITPPAPDRTASDALEGLPARQAPETPFNRSITGDRIFRCRAFPLDDIKALKTALGCTINDVVMAVCSGALRTYLESHNALPDEPLIAMVPVSIRTGEEVDPWTNRVSSLFVTLPTTSSEPIDRVKKVHDSMSLAKEHHNLIPADNLIELAQVAPPALGQQAALLASRLRLAERVKGVNNLVISNVPGPREPLYFAGARMKHFFPISIVTDGQGLNITVQSYVDSLDVGLLAAANLVPDLDLLMDSIGDEIDQLLTLTGLTSVRAKGKPKNRSKQANESIRDLWS